MAHEPFESFVLPPRNQRLLGAPHAPNTVTPLALRPSKPSSSLPDVVQSIRHLQAHDGVLTDQLARHGALLFRDVPIRTVQGFSAFAHAFGFSPHEIIGVVVDRPVVAPNVSPANRAPPHVAIYSHNESPQVPHAPGYIFLYAQEAPACGGETPVSSSVELFHRARGEMPDFVAALAQKGILSRVTYKHERQFEGGSTLRQAFGKMVHEKDDEATRRQKMEAQIRRYGRGEHTTWEWTEEGVVVTHRLPAIRTQPGTNLPTLFTSLAANYRNKRSSAQQLFGDGTPIPTEALARLADITDDIRVLHKWQRGDVLVFDNIVAQHGREPWTGEQTDRVVLASLFDSVHVPGAYSDHDWAQVVRALD